METSQRDSKNKRTPPSDSFPCPIVPLTHSDHKTITTWKFEKEKMLSLTQEDRKNRYWCRHSFVPLGCINTWAIDQLYDNKLDRNTYGSLRTRPDRVEKKKKKPEILKFNMNLHLAEKVSIYEGNITRLEVDAIVSAANETLTPGHGVDRAIHQAAGKWLRQENRTFNGCKTSETKISGGYKLPAKHVIFTVGPRRPQPEILERTYRNSLQTLLDNQLKSIAIPCISTGPYSYPNDTACSIALKTVRKFLESHHKDIDRVVFCTFLPIDTTIYKQKMSIIFPIVNQDQDK